MWHEMDGVVRTTSSCRCLVRRSENSQAKMISSTRITKRIADAMLRFFVPDNSAKKGFDYKVIVYRGKHPWNRQVYVYLNGWGSVRVVVRLRLDRLKSYQPTSVCMYVCIGQLPYPELARRCWWHCWGAWWAWWWTAAWAPRCMWGRSWALRWEDTPAPRWYGRTHLSCREPPSGSRDLVYLVYAWRVPLTMYVCTVMAIAFAKCVFKS